MNEEIFKIIVLSLVSLLRVLIACLLSLFIAIALSYLAISSKKNEKLLVSILEILQSIPVLSFAPGVMVLFSKLGKIGTEIGSIVLILTGAIWNLIFSYYSSLKSIPSTIRELSNSLRLGPIRKFVFVEFPYSVPQLTWNIILSFAGGWYFITYCEIFTVGELEYSVAGIGSYMMQKAESGEKLYVALSLLSIITVIALTFFLIWFPLLQFAERFKFEETSGITIESFLPTLEKKISDTFDILYKIFIHSSEKLERKLEKFFIIPGKIISNLFFFVLVSIVALTMFYAFSEIKNLPIYDIKKTLISAIFSTLRVGVGITIAGIIAIPLGIFVGLNKKIYVKIQPFIQIFSSLPAPAFIPLIYPVIIENEIGKLIGPIIVIFLSSFWYIFYNTVAGVFSIPSDAFEITRVLRMDLKSRLKNIILPGASKDIFVGFLTAWGGAWNGTFVAEHIHIGQEEFYITGIGGQISKSAAEGNTPLLIFSTLFMSFIVFITNALLWQRLIKKSAKMIKG